MCNGTPGARIDQVRILPTTRLKVPAIRARCTDGFVRESAGTRRVFDGDGPPTVGAQFAAGFDEDVGVAAHFEESGHLVDSPADSDAGKVHFQRRVLFAEHAFEHLEFLPTDSGKQLCDFVVRWWHGAARTRTKTP